MKVRKKLRSTRLAQADKLWHQIVVTDPHGLTGSSVAEFVAFVRKQIAASSIVVADLVGACQGLVGHEWRVLSFEHFLRLAVSATQYDWAFIFLYASIPNQEDIAHADTRSAMLLANATVRLADDQYFYVYTTDEKLASFVRHRYPEAEYKAVKFDGLDIPS